MKLIYENTTNTTNIFNSSELMPKKLTEEIMIGFGFEKIEHYHDYEWLREPLYEAMYSPKTEEFVFNLVLMEGATAQIRHVHELQLLWRLLTGVALGK